MAVGRLPGMLGVPGGPPFAVRCTVACGSGHEAPGRPLPGVEAPAARQSADSLIAHVVAVGCATIATANDYWRKALETARANASSAGSVRSRWHLPSRRSRIQPETMWP